MAKTEVGAREKGFEDCEPVEQSCAGIERGKVPRRRKPVCDRRARRPVPTELVLKQKAPIQGALGV